MKQRNCVRLVFGFLIGILISASMVSAEACDTKYNVVFTNNTDENYQLIVDASGFPKTYSDNDMIIKRGQRFIFGICSNYPKDYPWANFRIFPHKAFHFDTTTEFELNVAKQNVWITRSSSIDKNIIQVKDPGIRYEHDAQIEINKPHTSGK